MWTLISYIFTFYFLYKSGSSVSTFPFLILDKFLIFQQSFHKVSEILNIKFRIHPFNKNSYSCFCFSIVHDSVIVLTIPINSFQRHYFLEDSPKSAFWSWNRFHWICLFMANIEVLHFTKFEYQDLTPIYSHPFLIQYF